LLVEDYLVPTWRRVLAAFGKTQTESASMRIARAIIAERLNGIRVGDILRRDWSGMKDRAAIEAAFDDLNRVQFETHGSVCPIVTLIKGRNYDFQTGRGLVAATGWEHQSVKSVRMVGSPAVAHRKLIVSIPACSTWRLAAMSNWRAAAQMALGGLGGFQNNNLRKPPR
jgi:hypothetical protein